MIDPPPPAIIKGTAARLSRNAPVRLISSTLCQSAREVSMIVPLGSCGAAPLTRMSSRPKASWAASAAARVWHSLATSQAWDSERPPASLTSRAVSADAARSMSMQAIAAPSLAKATAIARQMPPPAPLIRAALPANCMCRLRALRQISQHHRAAIDRDGLAGDKPAILGNQPHHRPGQVCRHQVALDRLAGLDRVQGTVELIAEKLAGTLGDDRARRQRVDADAVAPEFARQPPGEADDRGFRGRVMQPVGHAVGRGERGDVDDAAAARLLYDPLAHRRDRRLAAVPDPFDID